MRHNSDKNHPSPRPAGAGFSSATTRGGFSGKSASEGDGVSICRAPECGNLTFAPSLYCCAGCASDALKATFSKWEAVAVAGDAHGAAVRLADSMRETAKAFPDGGVNRPKPAKVELPDVHPGVLSGSQRKTAFALRQNVERMIAGNSKRVFKSFTKPDGSEDWAYYSERSENLDCVGFLTLTVGETDLVTGKFRQVWDAAEASRRINSLNRRVLPALFDRAVIVTERHKSGAIHFHVVGILKGRPDIRTGFNFEQVKARNYSSVSPWLLAKWQELRETLPAYGFGRSELTPIRSTGEAVACYISKYIEKNICNRREGDRRKKLVRYIGWQEWQKVSEMGSDERANLKRFSHDADGVLLGRVAVQHKAQSFSWGTARACAWRGKARAMGALVDIFEREDMARYLGPRWAYSCTSMWQRVTGDDSKPFLVAGFAETEVLRAELVRMMGEHQAQKLDSKKLRFADEVSEMRAEYQNGVVFRGPVAKPVPARLNRPLPCARPVRKQVFRETVEKPSKPLKNQLIFVATYPRNPVLISDKTISRG